MIKKTSFLFGALALLAACSSAPDKTVDTKDAQDVQEVAEATAVEANVEASSINWVGFNTYSDGRHNGTIGLKSGSFKLLGDNLVGGAFVIDMNSVVCLDLENEEKNGTLVDHLKSDDFFAAADHPEGHFEITSVMANEGGDASHTVEGNLTLRGTSKSITIPANVTVNNGSVSVSTPEFAIDRKKWNVMFRSSGIEGVAKDKLIDDNILLELDIQG